MSLDVARRAADALVASPREDVRVFFLGGEPTLHPELGSLVRILEDKAAARAKRLRLYLSTNGFVLGEATLSVLAHSSVRVAISIDGDAATHDAQRPAAGGGPSHDRISRNAERCIATLGAERVTIVVMCTPWSVDRVRETWRQLRARFGAAVKLSFQPVFVPEGHPCAWTTEAAARFREAYSDLYALECDRLPRISRRQRRGLLNSESIHRREHTLAFCRIGSQQLSVATNGDVYPCASLVGNPRFLMGNVLHDTPPRLSPEARAWSEAGLVTRRAQCQRCWARYHCGGGCYAANFTTTGSGTVSSPAVCELYQGFAERSLRKLAGLYGSLGIALPTHASS